MLKPSWPVVATGSSPLFYKWFRNGNTVTNFAPNNSVYTILNVQAASAGSWVVQITNVAPGGSIFSVPAILTVLSDIDGDRVPDAWMMTR